MRILAKAAIVAAMSVACVSVAAPAMAAPAAGSTGTATAATAQATWQRVGFYEDYLSCEAVGIWDVFWGNAYAYDCESNPGHGWILYELI